MKQINWSKRLTIASVLLTAILFVMVGLGVIQWQDIVNWGVSR